MSYQSLKLFLTTGTVVYNSALYQHNKNYQYNKNYSIYCGSWYKINLILITLTWKINNHSGSLIILSESTMLLFCTEIYKYTV